MAIRLLSMELNPEREIILVTMECLEEDLPSFLTYLYGNSGEEKIRAGKKKREWNPKARKAASDRMKALQASGKMRRRGRPKKEHGSMVHSQSDGDYMKKVKNELPDKENLQKLCPVCKDEMINIELDMCSLCEENFKRMGP